MGLLDEALSRLLIGRNRPPANFNDVVEAFGDEPRRQNPNIARELSGVDGPLPRKGTPQRRVYDSALRRVNRWRTTAAERRRPSPAALAELRAIARRRLAGEAAQRIAQRGAWMRLTAEIKVSQTWKTHTMPADAGGRPRFQHLPGAASGQRSRRGWTATSTAPGHSCSGSSSTSTGATPSRRRWAESSESNCGSKRRPIGVGASRVQRGGRGVRRPPGNDGWAIDGDRAQIR